MKIYSNIKININTLVDNCVVCGILFILLFLKGIPQNLLMVVILIGYFLKSKKIIIFGKKKYLILIFFLLFYSIIIVSLNNTTDLNLIFRYFRCIISYLILSQLITRTKLSNFQIIDLILFLLILHAITILICIVFPESKSIVDYFNGYSKKFLRWRASGLVSGFDFAGILTNIGLLLTIFRRNFHRKTIFGVSGFIFILATLFTSRTSMIVLMFLMFLMFVYFFITKQIKNTITLFLPLGTVFLIGLFFLILTTDIGAQYREYLLNHSEYARKFYNIIFLTYSNSAYSTALSEHFYIEPNINIWFGSGFKPVFRDPGYINTIYRIGILGLLGEMIFYLSLLFEPLKKLIFTKFISKNLVSYCLQLSIVILMTLFMQSKLIFFFSSTLFEITVLLYFLFIKEGLKRHNG